MGSIINNNIAVLIVWFDLQEKSDQPEDGPWKGRNISLREAIYEHLSNWNIKQVVFDYILPIYFVTQCSTTGMSHLKVTELVCTGRKRNGTCHILALIWWRNTPHTGLAKGFLQFLKLGTLINDTYYTRMKISIGH